MNYTMIFYLWQWHAKIGEVRIVFQNGFIRKDENTLLKRCAKVGKVQLDSEAITKW